MVTEIDATDAALPPVPPEHEQQPMITRAWSGRERIQLGYHDCCADLTSRTLEAASLMSASAGSGGVVSGNTVYLMGGLSMDAMGPFATGKAPLPLGQLDGSLLHRRIPVAGQTAVLWVASTSRR